MEFQPVLLAQATDTLFISAGPLSANSPDWVSLFTALGGLMVAGLSVWLTFRSRTLEHRKTLYEQQIAFCMNLMEDSDRLHSVFIRRFSAHDAAELNSAWQDAQRQGQAFAASTAKGAVLLPDAAYRALSNFYSAATAAHNNAGPADRICRGDLEHLSEAFSTLATAIRDFIGVEALSMASMRDFGQQRSRS